jgi:hypothetical protein
MSPATGRKREADRVNARRTSLETAKSVREEVATSVMTVDLPLTGASADDDEQPRTGDADHGENDDDA